MAMPDTARRYTVDDVLAFPDDGNRYELVDGELLVTPAPAPRHQIVAGHLHSTLTHYLTTHSGVAQVGGTMQAGDPALAGVGLPPHRAGLG
jgi:Uma2 family endonuclease